MSWKSGSLNLLEPSGPHRACYGGPLPLPFITAYSERPSKLLSRVIIPYVSPGHLPVPLKHCASEISSMLVESVLLVESSRCATKPKPQPKLHNSFVFSGSLDEILKGLLINTPLCEGACGRRHLTHDALSNPVSLNPSPPNHLPTYYGRSCRKLLCPMRVQITCF